MITFTIAVKDGGRTRGEVVEFETLGPEELAQCRDLAHEMLDHLERVARIQSAKASKLRSE